MLSLSLLQHVSSLLSFQCGAMQVISLHKQPVVSVSAPPTVVQHTGSLSDKLCVGCSEGTLTHMHQPMSVAMMEGEATYCARCTLIWT